MENNDFDRVKSYIVKFSGMVALSLSSLYLAGTYMVSDTIRTKVTGTEVKRYDSTDKYLVYTENGTFENTDAWWRLKFDSSDLQGKIKGLEGKTIEIEKYGWRIPVLDMYENIVHINEVRDKNL